MCFAPQRRALFRQRNFQKWSEVGVFCAFWLRNVLRATTACIFSSLIWPAGSAPAALARLLLNPPEPQINGKTEWIATFLPFRAPASSLFWLSQSLLFSLLDSSSLTLPTSAFPSLHIVGSLTSKLPSIIYSIMIKVARPNSWNVANYDHLHMPMPVTLRGTALPSIITSMSVNQLVAHWFNHDEGPQRRSFLPEALAFWAKGSWEQADLGVHHHM